MADTKPQQANDPLYPRDPTLPDLKPVRKDDGGHHPATPSVPGKDVKKKPVSFHESCAELSTRLDAAVARQDAGAIEACWKDLDALKGDKANPAHHHELAALSARFHHLAPRKVSRLEAIEASLDAGLADKGKAVKTKKEHPAVTQARSDLAALHAEHANHVALPEDDTATRELEAKLADVPLVDD